MILKSTDVEVSVMKKKLKAFMDDITLTAKNTDDAKRVLKRLNELITWSRMKFKAKKSRSCTVVKGKPKEVHLSIAGERIPTVKEKPVKSLGRWYEGTLNDRSK